MKFILSLLILNFLIHSHKSWAERFSVALPIVVPFNPISNEINSASYIGLHLYYPLFALDDSGNLDSNFLDLTKTKAQSTKFDNYQLCIKEDLNFSDGTPIQSPDLNASLMYMSELYPHLLDVSEIRTEGNLCVHLKLKRPVPNLFKKLTGIASTILKKKDVRKTYPIGFGPYKIEKTFNDRLILSFNGDLKPRYNEIEFRMIKSKADLKGEVFQDFNQMPATKEFLNTAENSNLYSVPSLKVYSIVINLPNIKVRKCIQKSLMNGHWPAIYDLSLITQKSFLPWRTSHADWSINSRKCSLGTSKAPFLIPDIYDAKAVLVELKRLGVEQNFDIKTVSGADFAKWVFSGKSYVALMGFDSSSSTASLDGDFSYYFESFFTTKNRIITKPVPRLGVLIQEATRFDISSQERESKVIEAEKLLLDGGWVLPVGRLGRNFIFPENIKIEIWADKLNGFPVIWKIK